MFAIITSDYFLRSARKFFRKHPELKTKFAGILEDLCNDPFQSHLKLHPLKGKLEGLHAISLTYTYRITLTLKITAHEIILLDVGSHDEVY